VTALASCGALLIAAEGPFLRCYRSSDSQFLASKRVFKAQAVHGISVYSEEHDGLAKLVVWGGRLVRALTINLAADSNACNPPHICLSNVVKAPDWILDLAPRPTTLDDLAEYNQGTCAAVTAHNALLQVIIEHDSKSPTSRYFYPNSFVTSLKCSLKLTADYSHFVLSITELTPSSRSILYSAHVLWESAECILVAAGTAFGEIMYWSWRKEHQNVPTSRIHQVFLGHEGSVFGVRISKELQPGCCQRLRRVIASCSDDRTIRVWDVSNVSTGSTVSQDSDTLSETQRTRHTGFSNVTLDAESSSLNCLSIGWGHTSRVWTIQFLDSSPCDGALFLQSTGEDATSRTWKMVLASSDETVLPYRLLQIDCAAHHSGKNMWSAVVCDQFPAPQQVVCGAADSKITTYPLTGLKRNSQRGGVATFTEYTVHDIISMAQPTGDTHNTVRLEGPKKGAKADSIRSYCFLDNDSFLLTTNSGKVLLQSLHIDAARSAPSSLSTSKFVSQLDDLIGYSTCTSEPLLGVAFVAGTNGGVHMLSNREATLRTIRTVKGKVGNMFVANLSSSSVQGQIALLITLVGQKEAQLLFVDTRSKDPENMNVSNVQISGLPTGSLITSMACVKSEGRDFLFLGFRRGSVAIYNIDTSSSDISTRSTLVRVIDKVHGDETVTSMVCVPSQEESSPMQLLSVGRDGCLAIHSINLSTNSIKLVHNLALPIGSNIEGIYYHRGSLLVHGFSSKKWILYDVTSEEEIMGVETGGAHRSWAFQPRTDTGDGGTLVWTRASSMHICSQTSPNHCVIRSGGHGREIKAVTVNTGASKGLIATGAEDTDIKIFQYTDGHLVCRKTLRRHTTGIQHMQWSEDGEYLFSSGGSEEFYIWRIRKLPSVMEIGAVCESVYTPESEFSDLRIMSFDVTRRGAGYVIAMVFSDSSIKVWYTIHYALHFLADQTRSTTTIPLPQHSGERLPGACTSHLA
jgi:WD40 repeat protein